MANVIQELTGEVCESCIAYHNGIAEYFENNDETLEHVEDAATNWAEIGNVVLSAVEENPSQHFSHSCLVCGSMPYAGTVYDYTLTVFQR